VAARAQAHKAQPTSPRGYRCYSRLGRGLGNGMEKSLIALLADRRMSSAMAGATKRAVIGSLCWPQISALVLGVARTQQTREHAHLQPSGNTGRGQGGVGGKLEAMKAGRRWKRSAKNDPVRTARRRRSFTVAAIAAAVILLITLWGISVLAISPDRLAR
jgi:hypothetical protein